MSGSLTIGNKEIFSHSDATDKVSYGTGVPAGTILQVASGRGSSARYDTTNTAFHSITSATDVATLTTKFANSKFFLTMTLSFQLNSNHQFLVDFRRVVAGVTTQNITGMSGGVTSQFGDGTQWKSISYSHLDSPNLAAGTTVSYGLSARVLGGTIYLNDFAANSLTNITVMEIKHDS
mgnify:CR=1 FL=1